jgi:uncharacterized membrane protein (DUF373 family)
MSDKLQNTLWPGERLTRAFERVILSAVQLLLMVLILLAVLDLGYLLWHGATTQLASIDTVGELQKAQQRGFAGVLLVLIGLELLETIRAYLHDHHVRLEVVLIVAIIAVGRHVIQLDFEHLSGMSLLGIAALMLALVAGYFLVRRSAALRHEGAPSKSAPSKSDPNPEEIQQ